MNVLSRGILLAFGLLVSSLALQAQNCTVNAGVNTTLCPGTAFTLNGASSGSFASGTQVTWSQISGPAVTIVSPNSLITNVTGFGPGTYNFRLSAKCTDGSLIYDDVTYTVNTVTLANAGPDMYICSGTNSGKLAANTPGSGETGTWTVISGSTVTVATTNSATSNITGATGSSGPTNLVWAISNANGCISRDTVQVTDRGGVTPLTNPAVTVSACYSGYTTFALNASYGGDLTAANPYNQQGTWTVVSGPNAPTFSNIHDNKATVSNVQAGTYVFNWTVAGSCINSSKTVTINVPAGTQRISSAGGNATITYCDGRTSTVLTAPSPTYAAEVSTWTRTSGTGSIQSPASPTTNISALTPGSNSVFNYTISNPNTGCTSSAVYTLAFTSAPGITAPSQIQVACNSVAVSIPYTTTGGNQTQWQLVSLPSGVTNPYTTWQTSTASPVVPNTATFTQPGNYVFRLRRTNTNGPTGGCTDAYADVTVQVSKSPAAPNAGTNQILACNVYATDLAGSNPNANGGFGTGAWSQVSGPNTAVLANPASNTSHISGMVNGTYTFRWIVTGGPGCPAQQKDVSVIVADKAPTTAAAGSDQAICASTPYKLTGNTPKLNESGLWTVTPSTGVTFSDASSPSAIANGMAPSTAYTFTWTINNACGTSSSNVVLTTSATAGPEAADAGPDQCKAKTITSVTLAGNQPALAGETGLWYMVSGPNTPNFVDKTKYNTVVNGLIQGTYALVWQLDRNGCSPTRDTVLITLDDAIVTPTSGTNARFCGGAAVTLNGSTPNVGTGVWTQTAGPGGAVITDPTKNNTTVTGLTPGVYSFLWSVSNGGCSLVSSVQPVSDTIIASPTTANAGTDKTVCNVTASPTVTLAANNIATGTGTWSQVSGPAAVSFANANSPTSTVTGMTRTGEYKLRWFSSTDPGCTSSSTMSVFVNYKAALVTTSPLKLCGATEASITAAEGSTGTWTLTGTTPTGQPAPTQQVQSNTLLLSNLVPGVSYNYNFTMDTTGTCPTGTTAGFNVVSAQVLDGQSDSLTNAGPDVDTCIAKGAVATIQLNAQPPKNPGNTGKWTLVSSDNGTSPTFSNNTAYNSTFKNAAPGKYVLQWTISGSACTAGNAALVTIKIAAQPDPAVAGADQTGLCASNIQLNASTVSAGTGTWTQVSGPTTATIAEGNNPTTAITGITLANATPYVFRWTVSNGAKCNVTTSDASVTVGSSAVTTIPLATPSADTLCVSDASSAVTLNGNAPGTGESAQWSVSAGPNTPTLANANTQTATMNNMTAGTYTVVYKIYNGACFKTNAATVTANTASSTATTGATQNLCLYQPVTLSGNTPASGTGVWSVTAQPTGSGAPVFSSTTSPTPSVTGLVSGSYTFQWNITAGKCAASTSTQIVTVDDCRVQVTKTSNTPVLNTTDGSYLVTFTIQVANPGSTVSISNAQVADNLRAAFPSPKTFTVQSMSAPGVLNGKLNTSFDGNTDMNLLKAGTSLAPGASDVITLTVSVNL